MSHRERVLPRRFRTVCGPLPTLTPRDAELWMTVLPRSLKVGIEIEVVDPPDRVLGQVIDELVERLRPSHDNRRVGDHGVLTVSREHTGLEVKVIGQVPVYDHFIRQIHTVITTLQEMGCEPDGTCGMHYHLLAVNTGYELPAIVAANIWNLTRWYAPALRFLTSGGTALETLTRQCGYCDHSLFMALDPVVLPMREIKERTERSQKPKAHHGFLNIQRLSVSGRDTVSALHYEYRFPDMDMCPVSLVAKAFLFCAIAYRAVELSKFGLVALDPEELGERHALLDALSNDRGPGCMSDTSQLTPSQLSRLREGSLEMVRDLKQMLSFFDPRGYSALVSLAETPVSLLRAYGSSWAEIDDIMHATVGDSATRSEDLSELERLVELYEVTGCESADTWIDATATRLDVSTAYLRRLLRNFGHRRRLVWDSEIGAFLFNYR